MLESNIEMETILIIKSCIKTHLYIGYLKVTRSLGGTKMNFPTPEKSTKLSADVTNTPTFNAISVVSRKDIDRPINFPNRVRYGVFKDNI